MRAMALTRGRKRLLLAVAVLLGSACDAPSDEGAGGPPKNANEVAERAIAGVARCDSAIAGNADPRWRQRATIVGNLGFYGPGRDFDLAYRHDKGGDLVSKLPVIIEGSSGATVWVPREERNRVALLFGKIRASEPYTIEDGHAQVRFEPCNGRKRTGFVGGLILRDRQKVAFRVRLNGAEQTETVTLGRLPTTER